MPKGIYDRTKIKKVKTAMDIAQETGSIQRGEDAAKKFNDEARAQQSAETKVDEPEKSENVEEKKSGVTSVVLEGIWERRRVKSDTWIYASFSPKRQQFLVYEGVETKDVVSINLLPDRLSYWGKKIELESEIILMCRKAIPNDQKKIDEYNELKRLAETPIRVEVQSVDFSCKPNVAGDFFTDKLSGDSGFRWLYSGSDPFEMKPQPENFVPRVNLGPGVSMSPMSRK